MRKSGKSRKWSMLVFLSLALGACGRSPGTESSSVSDTIRVSDLEGRYLLGVTAVEVGPTEGAPVTFVGETGRTLVPVEWEVDEEGGVARLRVSEPFVAHRWGRPPEVVEDGRVVCELPIQRLDEGGSTGSSGIRVDWAHPRSVDWDVIWQRPIVSVSVEELEGADEPVRKARDGDDRLSYIDFVASVELSAAEAEGGEGAGDLTAREGCYPVFGPAPCESQRAEVRFSLVRAPARGGFGPRPARWGRSEPLREGVYEVLRPPEGGDDERLERLPARFRVWREVSVGVADRAEAARFAPGQCPAPSSGGGSGAGTEAELFYCLEEGRGCYCSVDGSRIVVLAEPAYTYEEAVRASPAEAELHAPSQCGSGGYSCDGQECGCAGSGHPVWKLTYRAEEIPAELAGRDGVVCPCDPSEEERWGCDPKQPSPCFFRADGRTVMYPTEQGSQPFPLRCFERKLRPVVYFPDPDLPSRVAQEIERAFAGWSRVLDDMAWRASGCEAAGLVRGEDGCSARPEYGTEGFRLLVLCPHNPPSDRDPEVCRRAVQQGSEVATPGDIRLNLIEWVGDGDDPGGPSPLSFGPPRTDPTTGEIVSATITIQERGLARISSELALEARLLTDSNARWAEIFGLEQGDEAKSGHLGSAAGISGEGEPVEPTTYDGSNGSSLLDELRSTMIEDRMMPSSILKTHAPSLIRAGFTVEEVLTVEGADLEVGSSLREKVSPLTWLDPSYLRERMSIRYRHLEETIIYDDMAPFPGAGVQLRSGRFASKADVVERVCGCDPTGRAEGCADAPLTLSDRWEVDPGCLDKVEEEMTARLAGRLAAHQLGHNLGLRNNYKGSFDVLNFGDEHWEIRLHAVRQRGDVLKERWEQWSTDWERINGIDRHMTSTLMDHALEPMRVGEAIAPGHWDEAVVNRAYGGFVPVFDRVRQDGAASAVRTLAALQVRAEAAWPTGVRPAEGGGVEPVIPTLCFFDSEHPETTPEGVVDARSSNRVFRPAAWTHAIDTGSSLATATAHWLEADGRGRLLIPMLHCSADSLNREPGCHYFDHGEDPFAVIEHGVQSFFGWAFWARHRVRTFGEWDEIRFPRRLVGDFLEILQSMSLLGQAWLRYVIEELAPGEMTEPEAAARWASVRIASSRAVESLSLVLTAPERNLDGPGSPSVWSPPVMDEWEEGRDFEWGLRRTCIGTIHDRTLVLQMLGERGDTSIWSAFGPLDYVPLEGPAMADPFPSCMDALMEALLSRSDAVQPRVCEDGHGELHYEPVSILTFGSDPCTTLYHPGQLSDTGERVELPSQPLLMLFQIVYGQRAFPIERSVFRATGDMESRFSHCNDLETDGCERLYFTDPFSYERYLAVRFPREECNAQLSDVSVGAAMLDRASVLEAEWQQALSDCGGVCEPRDPGHGPVESARGALEEWLRQVETMAYLAELRE